MPDIDNLGLLTINYDTVGRQVAQDDNANIRKGNCHVKQQFKQKVGNLKAMNTKGRMQKGKANTMQTIQFSQVVLLIQWPLVAIEMKTTSFPRQ